MAYAAQQPPSNDCPPTATTSRRVSFLHSLGGNRTIGIEVWLLA